jgi:hypothetical protein
MSNYFKFYSDNHGRTTEVTVHADQLDEVVETFQEFLRGCGYYFNGNLELVPDAADADLDQYQWLYNSGTEFTGSPEDVKYDQDQLNLWDSVTEEPVVGWTDSEGGTE